MGRPLTGSPLHVETTRLSPDTPLRYRDPLRLWSGAAALRASIERVGVLDPIAVRGDALEIVHGHRRVEVARELGLARVPVLQVEGDSGELLAHAVEAHAGRGDQNLREAARAVAAALRLGMSQEQVAARILPALGLEPHMELVRRYRRLLALPPDLLQLLLSKGFSLRRCLPFCDLPGGDALLLARLCQGLGARQIEETATALREICARDGLELERLVDELALDPLERDGLDRLFARRQPETTALRRRAGELARELGGDEARVTFDPNFTRDGVELSVRLMREGDLDRLVQRLVEPDKRDLLGRLLELLG